jgi:hypothetical protein
MNPLNLQDAALAFRMALRNASYEELEKLQSMYARWTMDSNFASALEPTAGISLSMQAEMAQRDWMKKPEEPDLGGPGSWDRDA